MNAHDMPLRLLASPFATGVAARLATAVAIALLPTAPAVACPGLPVDVQAEHPADHHSACDGARDALDFLAAIAASPALRVRIDVQAHLPPRPAPGCRGLLRHELAPGQRPGLPPFPWPASTGSAVPINRTLYRSVFCPRGGARDGGLLHGRARPAHPPPMSTWPMS